MFERVLWIIGMKRKLDKKKKTNIADKLIIPREKRIGIRHSENNKEMMTENDQSYSITPRGLLLYMITDLCPEYGKIDPEWFGKFIMAEKDLVEELSMLSSGGKDPNLFGESLNDMFAICIRCINTAAKYRKALENLGENPDEIAEQPFDGDEL